MRALIYSAATAYLERKRNCPDSAASPETFIRSTNQRAEIKKQEGGVTASFDSLNE